MARLCCVILLPLLLSDATATRYIRGRGPAAASVRTRISGCFGRMTRTMMQRRTHAGLVAVQSSEKQGDKDDGDDKNVVPMDEGMAMLGNEPTGPLACLLVGFNPGEKKAFEDMMAGMDADIVDIVVANQLDRTLEESLEIPFDEPPSDNVIGQNKRIVFLSGMYSGEIQEVMAAYDESDLPFTLWAMAVPNSMKKPLRSLVTEIMNDAAWMIAKEEEVAAEAEAARIDEGLRTVE